MNRNLRHRSLLQTTSSLVAVSAATATTPVDDDNHNDEERDKSSEKLSFFQRQMDIMTRWFQSTCCNVTVRPDGVKYAVVIIFMVVLLVLFFFFSVAVPILLGEHPVHGGYIGMFVDSRIRLYLWHKKVKGAIKEGQALGLRLPQTTIASRTRTVPHATVLELMHRYMEKSRWVQDIQNHRFDATASGPHIVIRKKYVWNRPLVQAFAKNYSTWAVLDFDADDMESFMDRDDKHDNYKDMYRKFQGMILQEEIFFLSFLIRHGGIYVDANVHGNDLLEFWNHDTNQSHIGSHRHGHGHERKEGWIFIRDGKIQSMVVLAQNNFLKCVMKKLERLPQAKNISLFQGILSGMHKEVGQGNSSMTEGFITLPPTCELPCFNLTISQGPNPLYPIFSHDLIPVKDISVTIRTVVEKEPLSQYVSKTSIDQLLAKKSRFCTGLWMWPCHRCLKSAMHGSYRKCRWVCSSCFTFMYERNENKIMHHHDVEDEKDSNNMDNGQSIHVNVIVNGYDNLNLNSNYKLIPRIIHQTWLEPVTPMNYPDLYRLQSQWKMSGWEYRLYTDETARQYIMDHFPTHFLEAYDAIIPGAYKADLFRYMLLMKEGGIYADIDVMLETSLEQFVIPSMSFFAPRDCVGEFASGQYCLWNGIIGAAPGHPIMIHAVERVVNMVLNRSDLLDLERDVARKSGIDTETWKVRAVQELLLSGPCALGISVNEALGRDSLTRFDVGWIDGTVTSQPSNPKYFGDMMILMQDKQDMGAMRFTDVERSIILASTDMESMSKDRIVSSATDQHQPLKQHYSSSGKGFGLWGTRGVYRDGIISKKKITFCSQYQ